MFMSMMRVRPVGVNMTFFRVPVFVNMRLTNDSRMFVSMMIIGMIV